jgi:hypothetical protein
MTPTNTPEAARLAEEAKRLARQLSSSAYSQGVAYERDSWQQQEKYEKQARDQLAQLSASIDALAALAKQDAAPTSVPPSRLAVNPTHEAADAFWTYWRENGETHRHGYYESTWGAINSALRAAGIREHDYGAAPTSASTVPAAQQTPALKRHALEAAKTLSEYAAAPFFPDTEKRGKVRATTADWWDGLAELIEEAQPLIARALRECTEPLARNPGACSVTDGEAKK